jgi:hypothetical protein
MSMAYSHTFALNVIAGYLLTVLGAVLALTAAVWSVAGSWPQGRPPLAFRALCTLAFAAFIGGILWQLVGYLHLEYRVW